MITENELLVAIEGCISEFHRGEISFGIIIRDIRAVLKAFDAQPTEEVKPS